MEIWYNRFYKQIKGMYRYGKNRGVIQTAEYKSVRSQLNTAGLELQNELLRNKLHRYETVIERNGLWNLFRPSTKTKDITRQEERL